MSLYEALVSSLKAIWSNKMRSFLTMLGIMIGIFSVAVLISVAQSSTSSITESIENEGTTQITISLRGRRIQNTFDLNDVEDIRELEGVKNVAPYTSGSLTLKNSAESMDVQVTASNDEYDDINNYNLISGRWISKNDEEKRLRVVVIGIDVADELYGTRDVVGEKISLSGTSFTIIGVLEEQGDTMMGSGDEVAFIPFATGQRMFGDISISSIYVGTEDSESVDTAMSAIENFMLAKAGGDDTSYSIFSSSAMLEMLNETTTTMTYLLGAIGGISLLVGGIGIMNIMLVSVSERTREIGVRKAIGATRANIMVQFLIEAVIVSGLGGVFGIILARLGTNLAGQIMEMNVTLDSVIVVVALGFSIAVGVIFGIYPAAKASKMNPIEALRYE
ncbi:MAG: ABC transporter permease [Clostridia bacterium]|nr:ABC transporter permease [Clostridia bacterium]